MGLLVGGLMWGGRAYAQSPEELQRQLEALQQQIEALKRAEPAREERIQQVREQEGASVTQQRNAVTLRPMETGRSVRKSQQRGVRKGQQRGVEVLKTEQVVRKEQPQQELQNYNYTYGESYNYPAEKVETTRARERKGGIYNKVAIKTNAAYWATMTPNLGIEFALGGKTTLELSGGFNKWGNAPVGVVGEGEKTGQMDHVLGKVEFRLWFWDRFDGHFIGLHTFYSDYDIYGMKVPLMFDKELRYDGRGTGFGLTYGYRWAWGNRWGLDLSIGAGMILMNYDKYAWAKGADNSPEQYKKTFFGPTNLGVKLFFMIN